MVHEILKYQYFQRNSNTCGFVELACYDVVRETCFSLVPRKAIKTTEISRKCLSETPKSYENLRNCKLFRGPKISMVETFSRPSKTHFFGGRKKLQNLTYFKQKDLPRAPPRDRNLHFVNVFNVFFTSGKTLIWAVLWPLNIALRGERQTL